MNSVNRARVAVRSRRFLMSLIAVAGCLVVAAFWNVDSSAQQSDGSLSGTASLSGTVTASQPFTAAQVFMRNVDKNILYMVFTTDGQFRARALFPGNFEVVVKTKGLESVTQEVVLGAGENPSLTLAMQPGAGTIPEVSTQFASYAELYPAGPGQEVAEQVCLTCHNENFLPGRPASEAVWRARLGHMDGSLLNSRDTRSYNEGALAGRVQWFPFAQAEKDDFVAYATANWGPEAEPRFVRAEQDVPMDEAVLGNAMFIEYYLPIDPPGTGSSSPEFADRGRGIRWGQDVRFDTGGNVWLTDRGYPNRLVKLDPRTGMQKDYPYPDGAMRGNHDLIIDRHGIVWAPEHSGLDPEGTKRLLGFNPETEQWQYKIEADPDNVIRSPRKWMQSMALDSKDNLYAAWIMGGALTKWDRAADKVTTYPISERGAVPYGVVADQNDNIWLAMWNSGKIVKFDTINEQWTEFAPLTFPSHVRRLNVDSQNNIWAAIWNAGRRPGKLAKLDQTTGRFTEWSVPLWTAQPYDINEDPTTGKMWMSDSPTPDRAALITNFDPETGEFEFYPKPQFAADSPKVQVTRDGAVWFSPRGSRREPAISVLYPDMDKITTLGAFYQYGPPGYAWPSPTTETAAGR